jgi:hypothetical protein
VWEFAHEVRARMGMRGRGRKKEVKMRGSGTYAELAAALRKAFIMRKSSKCICWMMIVGE